VIGISNDYTTWSENEIAQTSWLLALNSCSYCMKYILHLMQGHRPQEGMTVWFSSVISEFTGQRTALPTGSSLCCKQDERFMEQMKNSL
jgi:hypothetical protein